MPGRLMRSGISDMESMAVLIGEHIDRGISAVVHGAVEGEEARLVLDSFSKARSGGDFDHLVHPFGLTVCWRILGSDDHLLYA
jgi:hypothetical protein